MQQVESQNGELTCFPMTSIISPKKLATLSDQTLSSQQGLGYRDASREASGPRRSKVDQQGNHVSAGPGCFKGYLLGATRQILCMVFQMVNQLGPPLEMFEAR